MRVSLKSLCALFVFISTTQASGQDIVERINYMLRQFEKRTLTLAQHLEEADERGDLPDNFVSPFKEGVDPTIVSKATIMEMVTKELGKGTDSWVETINAEDRLEAYDPQRLFEKCKRIKELYGSIRSIWPETAFMQEFIELEMLINDIVQYGSEGSTSEPHQLATQWVWSSYQIKSK